MQLLFQFLSLWLCLPPLQSGCCFRLASAQSRLRTVSTTVSSLKRSELSQLYQSTRHLASYHAPQYLGFRFPRDEHRFKSVNDLDASRSRGRKTISERSAMSSLHTRRVAHAVARHFRANLSLLARGVIGSLERCCAESLTNIVHINS